MLIKKRNAVFGRYPCCDLLNNALRFLLEAPHADVEHLHAARDIVTAIHKANGYIYDDIKERVDFIMNTYPWEKEKSK